MYSEYSVISLPPIDVAFPFLRPRRSQSASASKEWAWRTEFGPSVFSMEQRCSSEQRRMATALTPEFLRKRLFALPKAELHLHMYGAMRRSTLAELCAAAGRATPQFPAGKLADFAQFSDIFDAVKDCVACEGDLRRLVREVIEDQAAAGCSYVELQCSPQHLPDLPDDNAFWRTVFDEAASVSVQLGVTVRFISVIVRSLVSPEAAVVIAEDAVARARAGDAIVGLGLAGAENDPTPFTAAFAVAKRGGLLCLPHQGELDVQGGGPPFVNAAVELLGADRLGHGIGSVASSATLAMLARKQICCEVCPTSNVCIGGTAALAYSTHPLPQMLRAGVPCCLGTDDPTVSPQTVAWFQSVFQHLFDVTLCPRLI